MLCWGGRAGGGLFALFAAFCDSVFGFEDFGGGAEVLALDSSATLSLLLGSQSVCAFLQVFVLAQIARCDILRVLQGDDVFPLKVLIGNQILPVLALYIEALHGIPSKDIPRIPESDDVGVVRKDLERDWVHVLAIIVFGKLQFDQIRALHRLPIHRVRSVLFDPW